MTSKNQENKDFYIWEGIYSSFKDAYKDAVGPGFSGEIYQERALSVVKECLTALDLKEPIPNFRNQSLRSNYLQIIIAIMKTYHTSQRLDQEDVLPMDNFPKNLRLARTLNLLLKRKV